MAEVSLELYANLLSRSGLLSDDVVQAHLEEFSSRGSGDDVEVADTNLSQSSAKRFAKYLSDADLVTDWQNNNLLRGRFRGLVFGKFLVLRLIGAGGMGRVFLARDKMLDRFVALKVLPKQRSERGSSVQRFRREARALAKLNHNNIVRVHDVDTREDTHYIVMEFVEGADLATVVRDEGPLTEELACDYILQTAAGLEHAHETGLIHRDIKPANLLLDATGTIKILDLGLAFLQSEEDGSITADPTRTLGTVDFVSPEQALNSHNIDCRTDLYSLGCTLHFLLTGRAPFANGTNAQRLMAHQSQTPPDINSARAVRGLSPVSTWLAGVCQKLMEKSPVDRFESARQLREQIEMHFGAERDDSTSVTTSGGSSVDTVTAIDTSAPTGVDMPPRSQKRRARRRGQSLWIFAGGLATAIFAIVATITWVESRGATEETGQTLNAAATKQNDSPSQASRSTRLGAAPSALAKQSSIPQWISASETKADRFYVVGNNKTYHRHDCSVLREKTNLREAKTGELTALKPCGRCNPDEGASR